jgi:2-polyprenyl-6-methoxyphenol hydroxylase-like FAD-dependent oxidoreductase
MDVVIVGGGPAGLYFASLYKRDCPEARVRVFERNAPDDTFGFGVAFQEFTLKNLAEADPVSQAGLLDLLQPWDNFYFHVRGVHHRISDIVFGGCSRRKLLELLQRRAKTLGVELTFERAVAPEDFPGADLIVVADGSGSRTRTRWADHFRPTVEERSNRFVWLGTSLRMDALNFFFNEQPEGIFVAHSYPHAPDQGTWIVEVTGETFARLGIAEADENATVKLVSGVFADELQGHPVIARNSFWRRFPLVTCERWVKDNVVLLGDAKGTVHFSIGSGTKIAMEDAVSLHRALGREADVGQALAQYEADRRPAFDQLRATAYGSMVWFEHLDEHWWTNPSQVIFAAATRKTTETYDTLKQRVPRLVADADAAVEGRANGDDHLLTASFRLGEVTVPNRVVGSFDDMAMADGVPAPGLLLVDPVVAHNGVAEDPDLSVLIGRVRTGHAGPVGVVIARADSAVLAAAGGFDVLVLDLSACSMDDGADVEQLGEVVAAVRATWPADRPLGARISCPTEPAAALDTVGVLINAGCNLIDVSGSRSQAGLFDRQVLLADLVRHRFGIATICGGLMSRDDADTVLASARADLVRLAH